MTDSIDPVFSVIIPTYNRRQYLSLAVDSVLDQTYKDFELIIVDDGSTDGTAALVTRYNDSRIKYYYHENRGVSYSRNRALKISKGKYKAFLDSDDRWVPHKLETSYDYIVKFPEIMVFHTDELWYRKGKILNQKKKHRKPDGNVYLNSLKLCCIGMSTSVVNEQVFEDIGYFDESLPACEDYDFWLRTSLIHKVKLIPEVLTIKDGGRPDQLSSRHSLDKYRIKSLIKILSGNTTDKEISDKTRLEIINKCRVYSAGALKHGKSDEAQFYIELANRYNEFHA